MFNPMMLDWGGGKRTQYRSAPIRHITQCRAHANLLSAPYGVARGTCSMTLLHIVGLAPRAPVAVRIKSLCACIRWPTQARSCPLLLLNTMQPHRARASNTSRRATVAFEAKYRLHCVRLSRSSLACGPGRPESRPACIWWIGGDRWYTVTVLYVCPWRLGRSLKKI